MNRKTEPPIDRIEEMGLKLFFGVLFVHGLMVFSCFFLCFSHFESVCQPIFFLELLVVSG